MARGVTSAPATRPPGDLTLVGALRADDAAAAGARLHGIGDAFADAVLVTDAQGTLLGCNRSAVPLFGHAEASGLALGDVGLLFDPPLERLVAGAVHDRRGRRADGSTFPVEVRIAGWDEGGERRWGLQVRDRSPEVELEARLSELAFHDPLTGLANRALFAHTVDVALRRVGRTGRGVGVLFLDLDDFKRVNDSLGHGAGDAVLRSTADRLRACIRATDTAARLGGDEFAVLVDDTDSALVALEVADRIARAMEVPVDFDGSQLEITFSIGVAHTGDEHVTGAELLRDADLAMYEAKARGKNCIELYEHHMHAATLERLRLEDDLRRAIDEGELVTRYQPLFDLRSGRLTGFEALVRWEHRTRGELGPDYFLELAEATGLIVPIGRAVLDRACHDLAAWTAGRADHGLVMSVNVSSRQIEDPGLVAAVRHALETSGLPASQLQLELPERLLVHHSGAAAARLVSLADLGVGLAVDDFGTGLSSLASLADLPVQTLKIDRSFVSRLQSGRGEVLVGTVLALAQHLGLTAVAEGIETTEQLRAITALGCPIGQGFLLARPLTEEEARVLLDVEQPLWWWGLVE